MPWVVVFSGSFHFAVCNVFTCLISALSPFTFHSQTVQFWLLVAVWDETGGACFCPIGSPCCRGHRAQHRGSSSTLQTLHVNLPQKDNSTHLPLAVLCPVHYLSPRPPARPVFAILAIAKRLGQQLMSVPWQRACSRPLLEAPWLTASPALVRIHLEQGDCRNPIKIFA